MPHATLGTAPVTACGRRLHHRSLLRIFGLFLFVCTVSFIVVGNAAEKDEGILLSPNAITIPKDAAETRQLLGDDFQYLDRSHLILISDLDLGTLTQLEIQDFQAYLTILTGQFFTKALNSYHRDKTALTTVFVFRDEKSYTKGLRDIGLGVLLDAGLKQGNLRRGYQFTTPGVNGVLIDYRDNYAVGLSIYAHELTHALVRKEYPEAPVWLNEGLATMFGHCRVEGGQLRYVFGSSLAALQHGVRDGGVLPLEQLFASTNTKFLGLGHGPYYDAAELFCRYLHSRNLLVQIYIEMRDGRGKGVNGSDTVARVAGRTLEELEKDWHEWLLEQKGR